MGKTVLVPLADGFEEIEAVTIIDVLRRAQIEVILCSLDREMVTGAQGIEFRANKSLSEVENKLFDAVILPGGLAGTKNLLASEIIEKIIKTHQANSKYIAAICAAPLVLSKAGILEEKTATSYPGFEDKFPSSTTKSTDRVVQDGKLITSRGPGTAMEFSLKLVELLLDTETAIELKSRLLAKF